MISFKLLCEYGPRGTLEVCSIHECRIFYGNRISRLSVNRLFKMVIRTIPSSISVGIYKVPISHADFKRLVLIPRAVRANREVQLKRLHLVNKCPGDL